jgi:serine/threonine protein kinase
LVKRRQQIKDQQRDAGSTVVEAMKLLDPAVQALTVAHDLGVVHRDVKPSNIQLSEAGVKLLDFGIAKVMDLATQLGGTMTLQGTLPAITPHYAAPEQFDAALGDIGPHTDLYSLALVMAELLSDRPPRGGSATEILRSALSEVQPTPKRLGATVSAEVEKLFERALAREASGRPSSVSDWWQQLKEAATLPALGSVGTAATVLQAPRGDAALAATEKSVPTTRLAAGTSSETASKTYVSADTEPPQLVGSRRRIWLFGGIGAALLAIAAIAIAAGAGDDNPKDTPSASQPPQKTTRVPTTSREPAKQTAPDPAKTSRAKTSPAKTSPAKTPPAKQPKPTKQPAKTPVQTEGGAKTGAAAAGGAATERPAKNTKARGDAAASRKTKKVKKSTRKRPRVGGGGGGGASGASSALLGKARPRKLSRAKARDRIQRVVSQLAREARKKCDRPNAIPALYRLRLTITKDGYAKRVTIKPYNQPTGACIRMVAFRFRRRFPKTGHRIRLVSKIGIGIGAGN